MDGRRAYALSSGRCAFVRTRFRCLSVLNSIFIWPCLGYYTRLIKMYRKLGIKLQPTYYTYSFSHLRAERERPRTHFLHQGRSGLASLALPAGGLRTKITGVLRLVQYALCYLYLLVLAYAYRETGSPGGSVAAWAVETGRGRWVDWVAIRWEQFVREMLYTLFGAISSASDQQLEKVDIGLFLGASCPALRASVAASVLATDTSDPSRDRLRLAYHFDAPLLGPDVIRLGRCGARRPPPAVKRPPVDDDHLDPPHRRPIHYHS